MKLPRMLLMSILSAASLMAGCTVLDASLNPIHKNLPGTESFSDEGIIGQPPSGFSSNWFQSGQFRLNGDRADLLMINAGFQVPFHGLGWHYQARDVADHWSLLLEHPDGRALVMIRGVAVKSSDPIKDGEQRKSLARAGIREALHQAAGAWENALLVGSEERLLGGKTFIVEQYEATDLQTSKRVELEIYAIGYQDPSHPKSNHSAGVWIAFLQTNQGAAESDGLLKHLEEIPDHLQFIRAGHQEIYPDLFAG